MEDARWGFLQLVMQWNIPWLGSLEILSQQAPPIRLTLHELVILWSSTHVMHSEVDWADPTDCCTLDWCWQSTQFSDQASSDGLIDSWVYCCKFCLFSDQISKSLDTVECTSSSSSSSLQFFTTLVTASLHDPQQYTSFGIESCWVCRLWWSFPCQRLFLFFSNSCIHWIHWIAVCFDLWQAYLLAHLKSVVTWITILVIFRLLTSDCMMKYWLKNSSFWVERVFTYSEGFVPDCC